MQLNKNTGEIIIIDKFLKDSDKCFYSEYENIIYDTGGIKKTFGKNPDTILTEIDSSILADSNLSINDNILKLVYLKLIENRGENWILSNEIQNWLFSEKPIRVFIDNSMSTKEMVSNQDYKTLMDSILTKHAGFIEVGDINTVIYVDGLDPADIAIIQDFIDVWIYTEEKLY